MSRLSPRSPFALRVPFLLMALVVLACVPRPGPSSLGRAARPVVVSEARPRAERHLVVKIDRTDLPQDGLLTVWMEPRLSSGTRCPNQGPARDFAVRMRVRAEGSQAIGSEQVLLGCVDLPARRIAWAALATQGRQLDLHASFERSGKVEGDVRVEWRLEAELSGQGTLPSNRGVTIAETDE